MHKNYITCLCLHPSNNNLIIFCFDLFCLSLEPEKDDWKAKRLDATKSKSLQGRITKQNTTKSTAASMDSKLIDRKNNAKHKRRQESVNCIEIKFDDFFEKDAKTVDSFPSKNPLRKNVQLGRKESPKVASCHSHINTIYKPKSSMTLAETIAKARGKRMYKLNTNTKIAWEDMKKQNQINVDLESKQLYQRENKTFFQKVRNTSDCKTLEKANVDVNDGRGEEAPYVPAPDIRFNAILEKLRKTASEF